VATRLCHLKRGASRPSIPAALRHALLPDGGASTSTVKSKSTNLPEPRLIARDHLIGDAARIAPLGSMVDHTSSAVAAPAG